MEKLLRKIDSYFLGVLLEIFLIFALFIFDESISSRILDFIMLCITFFIGIITYLGGVVVGLIASSIVIFVYASYIFYINLIRGIEIEFLSYVWMIAIPIISFTIGKLGNSISTLQQSNITLRNNYKNLVTIDKKTGLGNIRLFYMNLEKEMSKTRRHKSYLTLMLIKLPYYKEIKKILGESKTSKLIKDLSNIIIASTRSEDERYTIEDDTLAIIMANTNFDGAKIVSNRIKEGLADFKLRLKEENDYIDIDLKIAIVEYKDDFKTSLEFKMATEEELQYDV